LDNDIQAATAELEFLSGEAGITNNDLWYNRTGGVCRRENSTTGGSTGTGGIPIPVGGVDVLYLTAASTTYIGDFSGSYEGQSLTLHFANGNVQINNNLIYTTGAANITGSADDVMVLVRSQGAWRQQSPISAN